MGGSSGIGLGAAEAMLKEGASVTIVGRSHEKLQAARRRLGSDSQLKVHAADVTQDDQVKDLFQEIGQLDHLIVTRGVAPVAAPVASFDLDAVCRFIDVMLASAVSLAKHAAPNISRTGSITFTSGISKGKPGPGGAVVAAVAGSMTYFARALAREPAPVRVNVVSPGWVETPMWEEIAGSAKDQM